MPDSASLDRLVVAHLPAALRFATRLAGDAEGGEDLVQEALLKVVRRWSGFRGDAEFRTWFFRIIINVFRDRLRAAKPAMLSLEVHAEQTADQAGDAPASAVRAEFEELVAGEVSRLPPRQREVLTLVVYEGLSVRDVGQIVGISEANVHSTMSAARLRLKTRLAQHLGSLGK